MPMQPSLPLQQPHLPPQGTSSSTHDVIAPRQLSTPLTTQDAATKTLQNQNLHQASASSSIQQTQVPLQSQQSEISVGESETDTEDMRKLEQEFEKKLLRAKKSYGTRMDNLHRSKEEAEVQHLMTLEKHEKERIEFEKRVRLAEEEQMRRLNQIQKEFTEKKKEARQHRVQQPSEGLSEMQQNGHAGDSSSTGANASRPPLHGGHKRSSSHFDTSSLTPPSSQHQQASPVASDHKRNSSESDLLNVSQTQSDPLQEPQIQPAPRSLPPNLSTVHGGGGTSGSARDRSESTSS